MRDPRFLFGGVILLVIISVSIGAPWLAPFAPDDSDISLRLLPPDSEHWFGGDLNGSDVLTAVLYGGRLSLYVGFFTVFLSLSIGIVVGLVAGYKRGIYETILMRTVDLLMAFPGILLAMALASVLGPGVNNLVFAISATGWTSSARLMRAQVLSLREREFVTAVQALGGNDWRILFKHILPAAMPPLVVHGTFSLSGVILIESSLSFLGLGAQGGSPTWGALLSQGRTVLLEAPHLSLIPGLMLLLTVLALNFTGDALRDWLDPKET